jgi:hypothetical protein
MAAGLNMKCRLQCRVHELNDRDKKFSTVARRLIQPNRIGRIMAAINSEFDMPYELCLWRPVGDAIRTGWRPLCLVPSDTHLTTEFPDRDHPGRVAHLRLRPRAGDQVAQGHSAQSEGAHQAGAEALNGDAG